jgi:hypothetical protein
MIKIGWAEADITPIPEIAKKVSLSGQHYERISSEVRDRLRSVVLVLDGGDSLPSLIVSNDLGGTVEPLMEAVRKELALRTPEIPPESLIMAATHVHTSPFPMKPPRGSTWGTRFAFPYKDPDVLTPEAYTAFCAKKIAAACGEAWASRAPGGIALKTGRIAVPQCRRVQYKDGTSLMYGNTNTSNFLRIEGAADNGAEYLITYDASGKVTGTVINLACPAQILEQAYYITADYWGEVRKQWPEMPHVLPLCGAAGDLTMRDLVRRDRTEPSTHTVEAAIEIAGRVVRESKYIVSTVKKEDIKTDPAYRHINRTICLPIRTVTEEEYLAAKRDLDAFNKEYDTNGLAGESEDNYPMRRKDRVYYTRISAVAARWDMQNQDRNIEVELHAIRAGEAALINVPFELFQEYGNQIKALSPAPYTFIAQLSCGALGYLPNRIATAGGSYSAGVENGYVGPEGGDVLVTKALDAIGTVWK